MPIYEYECEKCGQHIEAFQNITDKPLKKCEACKGRLRKVISLSSFHLKGTGWYATDYANRSVSPPKSKHSDPAAKLGDKKESKTAKKETAD